MTSPHILERSIAADEAELRCRVPGDLVFLEGHFPGQPVVAGVVQLHWAMQLVAELLGGQPVVTAIEVLRFREVLLPEQLFTLSVAISPSHDVARFALSDEGRLFASGRIHLRSAAGAPP